MRVLTTGWSTDLAACVATRQNEEGVDECGNETVTSVDYTCRHCRAVAGDDSIGGPVPCEAAEVRRSSTGRGMGGNHALGRSYGRRRAALKSLARAGSLPAPTQRDKVMYASKSAGADSEIFWTRP